MKQQVERHRARGKQSGTRATPPLQTAETASKQPSSTVARGPLTAARLSQCLRDREALAGAGPHLARLTAFPAQTNLLSEVQL